MTGMKKKKDKKKEKACRQLSEQQVRELAHYIINETESAADISRGVRERKKKTASSARKRNGFLTERLLPVTSDYYAECPEKGTDINVATREAFDYLYCSAANYAALLGVDLPFPRKKRSSHPRLDIVRLYGVMENLLPEHVNLELVDGRLTFCLYRFHKWPDYELLWLPLEFTERLGPPVRRVVLEFIRRFIRHHRMDDLKGTYYYDMTEDYMERCTDDPDEYTPDDRRRITRLMASYDDGKIARLLKRMRGRAFCIGLEDGLESCRPQTDGERKLLELVREGMTLMGKGVPCIMDYQYDWIYEKEPDFMPAPLESQILLAYSTNDEIVRDMMSTFNVDMQESYNLTPVSTMLFTPETDRIFSMDDFPERFAGWFNRFVHHATHKI